MQGLAEGLEGYGWAMRLSSDGGSDKQAPGRGGGWFGWLTGWVGGVAGEATGWPPQENWAPAAIALDKKKKRVINPWSTGEDQISALKAIILPLIRQNLYLLKKIGESESIKHALTLNRNIANK